MSSKMKLLCSYIFPAVGSLFVTYLYNVMDGIFVGQGVGSAALGAVNIGVPFITFAVALVSMFPMGGATVIAIRMGRGDKDGANHAFMTALTLTALTAAALTIVGTVFSQHIVDLCGARKLGDEMRSLSADYLFYYSAFSLPMLMSNCLSVFVRNDGSPALSFLGMCTGAVSNIFLDWLFIFPLQMGVIGAAVASGLGQIVSLLVLLSHFIHKHRNLRIRRFTIQPVLIRKICKRGAPEAVTQITHRNQKARGLIGEMDSPLPVLVLIKSRNTLYDTACRQQLFCQPFIAEDWRALIAVFLDLLLREPAL